MDRLHEKIIGILEREKPGGRALDAGAGPGHLSKALAGMGFKVDACDIAPEDFEFGGIRCRKADLNGRFPYKNAEFSHVVCAEVVEHVENPRHLVQEAGRVMKNGGLLVISTPNIANMFSRLKFLLTGKFYCFSDEERRLGHLTPVPWWELEEALKACGFRIEQRTASTYLMICGGGGMLNAAKRLASSLACILLYPITRPKDEALLRGDSIIIAARKVTS